MWTIKKVCTCLFLDCMTPCLNWVPRIMWGILLWSQGVFIFSNLTISVELLLPGLVFFFFPSSSFRELFPLCKVISIDGKFFPHLKLVLWLKYLTFEQHISAGQFSSQISCRTSMDKYTFSCLRFIQNKVLVENFIRKRFLNLPGKRSILFPNAHDNSLRIKRSTEYNIYK